MDRIRECLPKDRCPICLAHGYIRYNGYVYQCSCSSTEKMFRRLDGREAKLLIDAGVNIPTVNETKKVRRKRR